MVKLLAGRVRYRDPACPHVFQLTYKVRKEKIVAVAFNGSGGS
jgi:NifU-like protein involved in Fe-S cluster formation